MPISTLRTGSTGPAVHQLQRALRRAGFDPGSIDGRYGRDTRNAVVAYQRRMQLQPDGIAGPRTIAALRSGGSIESCETSAGLPVGLVSHMFPSTPVANIEAHLPRVLAALDAHSLSGKQMRLAALSTIRAETESFLPVAEAPSRYNTSAGGHAFNLYDCRADLGNRGAPDGEKFRGRGFVQLTGRLNYAKYGARLSPALDLVSSPDLASRADIAAELLALFLADRAAEIESALLDGDLARARKLVNGGAHGLSRFADAYLRGSLALGAGG